MSQQLRSSSFCSVGKVLYLNEDLRDLTVIVQTESSQWKFPAHKLILASESTVLRSKLEDENINEIVLDDITPSTAELLLRYIYCGDLEVESWNEGVQLLEAAFRFEVADLVQKCGRFLEDVISLSNVCYIYDKASTCSLSVLQDKCLKLILDAGFIVLRSSAFEVLNKDCVMDIVASSDLNIDSELTVFQSLFRWARIECCRAGLLTTETNVHTQIKPFLQHVCIDDMSDADKSALPPTILTCVKPNNRNRIGFSVLDSLLLHSQRLEFEINQNCLDFIGDHLCCLRFSVDCPLNLIGLRFSLVANARIPLNLPLTLVKENVPKTTIHAGTLSAESSIQSSQINQREWHDIEVLLRHPVSLKVGDVYNLYVVDSGTEAQCPRSIVPNNVLKTLCGFVNFTVHGNVWGITCLKII